MQKVEQYYQYEWKIQYPKVCIAIIMFASLSQYTLLAIIYLPVEYSNAKNGTDCGIFVCQVHTEYLRLMRHAC